MTTLETEALERRKAAMKFIVCLGVVSLFADMTYEGAYSIIGPFLQVLHANAFQVGLITGFGEMCAASLRYFSGKLADRTRAYWALAISGYVMNLVVIPGLAFAGSWQIAALLVIAERTGKALRGPARDVLLSEATGEVGHGWGFGLHGAMDQTGAMLGPLWVAWAVLQSHHIQPAFLRLAFPAAAALAALLVAMNVHPSKGKPPKPPSEQLLPQVFWYYIAAAGLLAFGFVDFPLLAFHFQNEHLTHEAVIPLLYSGAMGVEGLTGLVVGKIYDRFGIATLTIGTAISLLSLPFGFLGGFGAAVASVACWAVGMGAQDACLRSGIAQVVSMNKRGSAFGIFNAVFGIMWFAGSATMGYLLYHSHIMALVIFGVSAQGAAALLFLGLRKQLALAAKA